jgi:hypothetical protein
MRTIWALALVTPILGGLVAWLWMGATTSAEACATGENGGLVRLAGFVALLLAPPLAIAWQARGANVGWANLIVPLLASLVVGVVILFYVSLFWWSGHDCMT